MDGCVLIDTSPFGYSINLETGGLFTTNNMDQAEYQIIKDHANQEREAFRNEEALLAKTRQNINKMPSDINKQNIKNITGGKMPKLFRVRANYRSKYL